MSDLDGGRSRARVVWMVVVSSLLVGGSLIWRARHSGRPDGKSAATEGDPSPSSSQNRAPLLGPESSGDASGGVVEGRVVDPQGRAVASATVTALRQPKRGASSPMLPAGQLPGAPPVTRTVADGTFHLELPASGSFVLGALAPGYTGAFRAGVEVVSGGRVTGVELKLGTGGSVLSGRFLDAGGGPIPGGRLRVMGFERGTTIGPQLARYAFEASADGEGRYRVQLPPARYSLEALADGYAPARDFTNLTTSETKDFRLEPAARIVGRVVTDANKRPVAGAEVRVQTAERRYDLTIPPTISGDDGTFRFEGLPGGSFRLSARKDDDAGAVAQPITIAAGAQSETVEIALSPGLTVSGVVTGPDGKPVANADVNLSMRVSGLGGGPMGNRLSAKVDAGGRFRLAGLVPGDYTISASAEGRSPRMEELTLQASLSKDFVLEPTAVVSGVVLTAGGQPAVGAQVEASVRPEGKNRMGSSDLATADPQGRFTLSRLSAGKLAISAQQANDVARLVDVPLANGEKKELTLKLQPGARVSGVVSWDDGSPAANLKVTGMQQRGGGGGQNDTRSAADGTFTVAPFAPGEISVVVMPPGERTSWSSMPRPEQADLKITAGEHRTGVKLVAARRSGTISGVILAPDGQPLAGVSVMAGVERDGRAFKGGFQQDRSVSGPDGAFALESLKKGTYTLWAASPEHPEAERTGIATGSKDVRIQLSRAASLAGVFVAPDGKPVSSYTLVAVRPGKDSVQMRMMRTVDEGGAMAVNDPGGAFQVARLTAGHYDLVASAPDGKAARLEVSVSEGEKKQGVRLVAEGGVTVQGRVIEFESGEPLPGMDVRIRAGATNLEASTDAQGGFQIANVPTIPGLTANVGPRERTHIFQSFAIPAARDGRADVGTIKLLKFDPQNPNKGRLGINFNKRDGKLVITEILPDTPAARAGIKVGDAFVSVDGRSTNTDWNGATNALRPEDPGKEIRIMVQTPGQDPRPVIVKRAM